MLSNEYSAAIHAAVRIGKRMLNRYYGKTDYSNVYRIAMSTKLILSFASLLTSLISVLDPRYKLSYFRKMKWEESWITEAQRLVKEALSKYTSNHDTRHDSEDDNDVIMVRDSTLHCHFCNCTDFEILGASSITPNSASSAPRFRRTCLKNLSRRLRLAARRQDHHQSHRTSWRCTSALMS